MEPKIYKTYRQLINKLRSRGMKIEKGAQGARVIRILEKENYYNIINGYKTLFIKSAATAAADEQYKEGTTFDEVYSLYCFDREIRSIYLKYILKIEHYVKTVIAHKFSEQYGHDNYLKKDNFNPNDTVRVIQLIAEIQLELARQMEKNHHVVKHYMTKHGYIPLWVLVDVLTFGKITKFYLHMKVNDKKSIAKEFKVNAEELHKYMNVLSLARNKCAHDERFFDFHFKTAIHTKSIPNFALLNIPKGASGYDYGIKDLYAVAIILSRLLSKTDLREFCIAMKNAFKKLDKRLHTIGINEVMSIMGFGVDWQNLRKL